MTRKLLDAAGVEIQPGDTVVVCYGIGDAARPFWATVVSVAHGKYMRVKKTSSGYPYVRFWGTDEEGFERPERMVVVSL